MAQEVELKLDVRAHRARGLVGAVWLKKLSCGPMVRQRLVSVYYDTDDLVLRDRQAVLRVRQASDGFVQTFKAQGSGGKTGLARLEWERPVGGPKPELHDARKKDTAGVNLKKLRKSLKPVFETTVERKTIPVKLRGSRLEVAIDLGQVKRGRMRLPIHEVEVELKEGKPDAVIALGKRLAAKLAAAYGVASKAERGYALRERQTEDPVCAKSIALSDDMTTGQAFQTIAMSCLRHFASNRAAVMGEKPEGVHQMRVGLRRLRAAVSVFKEILPGPETERIKDGLKWLTDEMGPARDMDVLVRDGIAPLTRKTSAPDAVSALQKDVSKQRSKGFARARKAVESDRYRRLVLETVFWITGGPWARSQVALIAARRDLNARCFATQELQRRTHKVVKKLRMLHDLDPRKRHKLRIAIKKIRYATGYFESLFCAAGKPRKRFEDALKDLQSSLGRLNDIRVHDKLAKDYVHPFPRKQNAPGAAFAMGLINGREQAEEPLLLKAAKRRGRRFERCRPFWR